MIPLRRARLASLRSISQHHRLLTTLGIRREDPTRIWERRVPLTPHAISSLLSTHGDELAVEVESCQRRCFPDHTYAQVGAKIVPCLSRDVDLVLGIKEPPVPQVQALVQGQTKKRSWMVFSHTHKGQEYNTPLLASFLGTEKQQTLLDWELLTGPSKRGKLERVAAFGWFAGAVGAGEALSLTGLALLKRGIATPLLHLPRPYTFSTLNAFKSALRETGDAVKSQPAEEGSGAEGPIVIGYTGAGRVSDGVKDMLQELGVEWVSAEDLPKLSGQAAQNRIYACAITPSSYFTRSDGSSYSRDDYFANPDKYQSTFAKNIAPFLTTLINGAGWQIGFPSIMSNADMVSLGRSKLAAVQDITADLKGNLEFVDRHTTIDQPYFEGPNGILVSVVDILPTELAADASEHFSHCIMPYINHFISSPNVPGEVADSLQRATIVDSGELTRPHQWLKARVDSWNTNPGEEIVPPIQTPTSSWRGVEGAVRLRGKKQIRRDGGKKKVLLLGSGLVAGPAVEVFAARKDILLAIASNNAVEAKALAKDSSNVETMLLDVSDEEALGRAVSSSDVVVSLLPAPMHPQVAKHCITYGKHLVTASYVSPEMKALHQAAVEKDVLLLGECGLDPGIDSMAAMRILDRVRREGKQVRSFISWCGGLPEPSASNVPLGYKFSWSPKAVLTAAQNDAVFKLDGKIQHIAGSELLAKHFPKVDLWKGLALEGLANRDSMPYASKYGLGEIDELTDLFRGTLRYQGFSRVLDAFRAQGLISSSLLPKIPGSWSEFVKACRSASEYSGHQYESEAEDALDWLLSTRSGSPPPVFPSNIPPVPIDIFAYLLSDQLKYQPHEIDSCLLHHTFKLSIPGSRKHQTVTASLLSYGTKSSHSAMAMTVSKTLAFAALRVLDGEVKARGVMGPYEREVWEGVLDRLEFEGVKVQERWE
ncbi:putative Saccharopine dehydrogenase [Naematelia encephala]|uniref:Putative Saccharopine dehydrogenase n=1 Tax=Naematelia encephala TaxID=71784 RepID=A0A1Y2BCE3_9TREE|nr:putative Saccharopine dehydrogenase [Naematelia encephala]